MARLARRIGDKRLPRIVRRFLQAGMMQSGVCIERHEGTPQGGPLSPLLANLLLDDLDKELERRGHCFCRYADDCNIYVRSQAAGERVMASVVAFLESKLRLKVNRAKSAVAPVMERSFLGHRLLPGGRLGLAPKSLDRAKERLRRITRRNRIGAKICGSFSDSCVGGAARGDVCAALACCFADGRLSAEG
jgi:RNA-directed DNA polymerase